MCSYIRSFRDSFLDISERPPCEIHLDIMIPVGIIMQAGFVLC